MLVIHIKAMDYPSTRLQSMWSVRSLELELRVVTARTNASEPKLERMLYYEDTKLKRRKGKRKLVRG